MGYLPPRKQILIVDDDPAMLEGLRFIIGGHYELTCVSSGEAAIEATAKKCFPVAILDLQMEGISGLDTLREWKCGNQAPKVIILTGRGTMQSAIEALNLGAFRYLVKPFEKVDLQDSIEAAHDCYEWEKQARIRTAGSLPDQLSSYGLSQRQQEIAELAIRGAKNREIAEKLSIKERTVEKHMEGILLALNVASRAKMAALIGNL